jgi:predicted MPP superfamily phosphohydrolase
MNEITARLERRRGRMHAKQRLGIETDREAQIFGQGINFFHIENWYSIHSLIRTALKLSGLYSRGQKNAQTIQIKHNDVRSRSLPSRFEGFTLLHISDLHADISGNAMQRLAELLPELNYNICVLTGDYRGPTFGPFDMTLKCLAALTPRLHGPIFGVLGNHDTVRMVP